MADPFGRGVNSDHVTEGPDGLLAGQDNNIIQQNIADLMRRGFSEANATTAAIRKARSSVHVDTAAQTPFVQPKKGEDPDLEATLRHALPFAKR